MCIAPLLGLQIIVWLSIFAVLKPLDIAALIFFKSNELFENAIIDVLIQERNITKAEAQEVLENLESAGKYQKDVY